MREKPDLNTSEMSCETRREFNELVEISKVNEDGSKGDGN